MDALISTYAGYPDLFGPHDGGATHYWPLPEPWSSVLTIALGVVLVVARRPLARLFAAMLWLDRPPGQRALSPTRERLVRADRRDVIGGVFFATISAFHVTPA